MPDLSYHNQRDILNTNQLREMLPQMPSFCTEFFRAGNNAADAHQLCARSDDFLFFSL